ncbi:YdcF family protein [Sphingobacterium rhinopitheci]|nr:YdcF family protein [Sphingobacterium rhinopitheci]
MRAFIICLLFFCATINLVAQNSNKSPIPSSPEEWGISKNYYLNYLLYKQPSIIETLVLNDKGVGQLLSEKKKALHNAVVDCKDVSCYIDRFKWSDDEILILQKSLNRAYDEQEDFRTLVHEILMSSSKYSVNDKLISPKEYLTIALVQDFKAMNFAIDVYAGGKKPNYPRIDSISFNTSNKSYLNVLKDVQQDVLKDMKQNSAVFFLPMISAIRFLEINERWDAALLEPLEYNENLAAIVKSKDLNWSKYPYSALLVLGAGPDKYNQPISPGGILRCRMAARAYQEGLVPFIIVSGGRVHPYKTPYVEAIEMKKYLVEVCNIAADAILIDPHARHTTTNMRNGSRLLLKYGFPKDKMSLVGSSIGHIDTVEKMGNRCVRELGYVPYTLGKRVSDVLLEFLPSESSFVIDWDEPLDP